MIRTQSTIAMTHDKLYLSIQCLLTKQQTKTLGPFSFFFANANQPLPTKKPQTILYSMVRPVTLQR